MKWTKLVLDVNVSIYIKCFTYLYEFCFQLLMPSFNLDHGKPEKCSEKRKLVGMWAHSLLLLLLIPGNFSCGQCTDILSMNIHGRNRLKLCEHKCTEQLIFTVAAYNFSLFCTTAEQRPVFRHYSWF